MHAARQVSAWLVLLCLGATAVLAQAESGLTQKEQLLMDAAYEGRMDLVERLVTEGTSAGTTNATKHTPLMWAAFNGHTEIVGYLIQQGASVDARDENGRTALMYASSGPFVETVQLLLDKGADVNAKGTLEGFTALMTAAAEGQVKVVKLLLKHGADASVKDKDNDTALSFAQQKGHPEVVEVLKGAAKAAK
jgi:ankyrin repeat protein